MKRSNTIVTSNGRITQLSSQDVQSQTLEHLWTMRLFVKEGGWLVAFIRDYNFKVIPGFAQVANRLKELSHKAQNLCREDDDKADIPTPFYDNPEDILKYLCALELISPEELEEVPPSLVTAWKDAERQAAESPAFQSPLQENLNLMQNIFSLTDNEKLFIGFVTLACCRGSNLNRICCLFNCSAGLPTIGRLFARATGVDEEEALHIATNQSGRAFRMVQLQDHSGKDPDDWLEAVDPFTFSTFINKRLSRSDLQEAFFSKTKEPELTIEDYQHVPEAMATLIPYLSKALATKRTGVNVLLYGDPGTGKTQLTRVIGREVNAKILEVSCRPIENNREKRTSRLRAWENAGLCLEPEERALFVMDECEDIFMSGLQIFNNHPVRDNKAEINHLLENNPHPTFWLTNSLTGMEAAMLRRFDIVLEVMQPTVSQRRRIIDKAAGDLLSDIMKDRLARTEKLAPGVITRTLSVIKVLDQMSLAERDSKALSLINSVLNVQKAGQVAPAAPIADAVYDTAFVNTDEDLVALANGVRQSPSARICLYGPPGTGKSAYAAWLAKTLEKPLLIKKASDFLSKWVGETETNIAAAFREAAQDDAVLLIDEADSFLQDRTRSEHSWETTQVNEMLTQMEQFTGIFIATTNLVDTLDPASLRRFDLKAEFKCLKTEQRRQLFCRWIETLKLTPDAKAENLIASISNLTPGDFAATARQSRFRPILTAEDFARRLGADCRLKEVNAGVGKPIGFC